MIRPVREEDAGRICEIYNHYVENSVITFETAPVTIAEMEGRIGEVTESLPWLVCERDGEILGYAYASKWKGRCAYRHSVESTVYVDKDAHGGGLGTRLYEALLDGLKSRNIHAVIGGIALPNEKSSGLHEKMGFEKIAHFREVGFKFGKWIDVGYWEKVLPS